MAIKVNSIVKNKNTKEIYEVISITGVIALCKAVNLPIDDLVPFRLSELEVMMEDETDAFNILFRGDDDSN